ncbi:MAG TPA: hypothetical protein VKT82_32665 [Ktedonobacterales bacterium]|nr:hypothetical protein [Ktedonobacterales bacterium]
MAHLLPSGGQLAVALEIGPKRRVFTQVCDWVGWCRAGKDEDAALQALFAAGPRYAQVAERAGVALTLPASLEALVVVERVSGTAVTDFGALSVLLAKDAEPLDDAQIARLERLLLACWATLDDALKAVPTDQHDQKPAHGRAPNALYHHVLEADMLHLAAFGPAAKPPALASMDVLFEQGARVREQFIAHLRAVPRGQTFEPRRRQGFAWTPRFAVRRAAWHALDHAWELQARQSNPA